METPVSSSIDPLPLGIILVILLIISAFFSGSETAMLGFDWLRLKYLERKGDKRAKVLKHLLSRRDILIGTILVGNNIANVAASSIATALAISFFGDSGIAIATALMTVCLLIFSEVAPKTYASTHTEKVGLSVARTFSLLSTLLFPLVVGITTISNAFLRILGAGALVKKQKLLSEEEISSIISDSTDSASLAENKRKMLHGIFEMSRHTVREIMVPRTRVKTLEISTPIAEAASRFVKTGYTRLPVYRENLDTIIGVCHARDVLELVASGSTAELGTVIREILYVPEKMTLEDLLFEFQKKRTHMAVVIDEYSGVEGIATLEDVLEEIVGEIQDEHDLEGDTIRFLPGGEAMVRGIASLRDVNNSLGLAIPTDVDVTLGGFAMTTLGHIPKSGESFIYENSRFTVERTSGHRVLLIRVTPIPLPPPSGDD